MQSLHANPIPPAGTLRKDCTRPGDESHRQVSYFRTLDERGDSQGVTQHTHHDDEDGHDTRKAPQSHGRPAKIIQRKIDQVTCVDVI